mgnify:CR=1 FL=1
MKFEKEDLNSCMLFKLRSYGLCVLLLRRDNISEEYVLYNNNYLNRESNSGLISIKNYKNNLQESTGLNSYDIIAIKQLTSTNKVLYHVLNGIEPREWDWTEKDDKIEEINSYVKSSFEKLGISLEGKDDKINIKIKFVFDLIRKEL